jgi:hypothetical protein
MKIKGGDGSDHAIAVYGNMGQQHAVNDHDNTIATKASGGGKQRKSGGKKSVFVPLALTVANHLVYKRLRNARGRSSKRRFSSRKQFGKKQGGNNSFTNIAVPTALTAMSYLYGRNRKTNKHRRNNRTQNNKLQNNKMQNVNV